MPELRILNQNTFFSVAEISDQFKTPSSCHFVYGDGEKRAKIYSALAYFQCDVNQYIYLCSRQYRGGGSVR